MEMVKTKLIFLSLLCVCGIAGAQEYNWETVPMDGHMVGAAIPSTDNVEQALGKVKHGRYTAPNGKRYKGSVAKVADLMIEAQPSMAFVKEKIGYAPEDMKLRHPESALSDMLVDFLMKSCEDVTGLKVDVGLLNFGGIRTDIHKGDVILDDFISMMPFKNYLAYVRLKGSDLRAIYESMAQYGIQVVGGAKLCFSRDEGLVSVEIAGEPLDDNKEYGLATVDFLLDGGDHFQAAKNARELIMTDVLLRDGVLEYVKKMVAEKNVIEYKADGRVVIL